MFLGRHLVEAALSRQHQITLFNRGSRQELYPEVEQLTGDRDGDLDALKGRTWDVVFDTSGYVPRVVGQSAALLRDAAQRYVFVSSVSVYDNFDTVGIQEEYPVGRLTDESSEDINADYGPLKALSERAVQSVFADRSMIVRPGLIVGPYDPTDRFTYWVRRFSEGAPVLVPGRPNRPIQYIDARDLAFWMVHLAEAQIGGVVQATGPVPPITMEALVDALQMLPGSGHPVWVSESFLRDHEVQEWSELPLWLSEATGWPGFMTVDVSRAISFGLTFRPLAETLRDYVAVGSLARASPVEGGTQPRSGRGSAGHMEPIIQQQPPPTKQRPSP